MTLLARLPRVAWAGLGVAVLAMALRAVVPLWVVGDTTIDDLLFVRLANSAAGGHWLGDYSRFTLIKGPGFPLFLAVSERLHTPPLLALQALHVAAAVVTGVAVARVTRRTWWGFALYAVLALDPSYYGAQTSRLLRDDLYASLTLLLLAVFLLAAHTVGTPYRVRYVLGWGLVGGGGLTAYWLTREEHVWLVPSLALMCVAILVVAHRAGGRAGLVPAVLMLLVVGLVLQVGVLGVKKVNEHKYGVALVTDVAEGEYPRTYALWQSVKAGGDHRYVPVSQAQRTAVYAVSPAARELQPVLEGQLLQNYSALSCALVRVCDGDYTAGFFPYALRDALAATGHERQAQDAQRFLRVLGDQISSACTSHALACRSRPPGLLPRSELISVSAIGRSAWSGTGYLLSFGLGEQDRPASAGSAVNWRFFAQLPGVPATRDAQRAQERAPLHRAQALEAIRWLYCALAVAALPLALLGFWLALRRRRLPLLAVWFGLVAAVTVLVRLALLALVDATSFPATHNSYVLPATAPLCIALTMGLWCLWEHRTDVRRP